MAVEKKMTAFYLYKEPLERFQRMYPRLATIFVNRCLLRALQSKDFFDDVFFNTEDPYLHSERFN